MIRRYVISVILYLAAFPVYAQPVKKLATINAVSITEGDYRKAIAKLGPKASDLENSAALREELLNHLIDLQLLVSEAQSSNLDRNVDFQEKLAELKRELLAREYMNTYIAKNSTESNLRLFFEKNKERYIGKEVRISHILFKEQDLSKAQEVLAEVQQKDAIFDEMAKKNSIGPSAPRGGDLGFVSRGKMVPEFDEAAFKTEKGKIYPKLVKTQFGYHIIKVTDVRGGSAVTFEEKRAELLPELKKELKTELLKSLRSKARIDIDEDALQNLKP